ncbi:2,6-dihydropseudooxynicotine hydrolase [Tolypocladium capitatum]|uniref:2,6-dihydropseudooxynicotine hydrolase n=1 Tax=Tolypocladium capitatum TaxID=45235 RepID=A0A2K3Q896_9HYPO|nr:2,6-dihydropseudooxynicotine hydrolase [Tolypocladium capitatum]
MHKFFSSEFFNFEYLRLIAMAPHEGAEIGEALEAAGKIRDDDPESWYRAFLDAGNVAEQIGQECERAGDRVGARRGLLRSSNYLRAAQFMLNEGPIGQDPRVLPTIERSIVNFRKGVRYRDGETYFLNIPYESGIKLPGYLYLPEASKRLLGRKTPVLINSGGGDSTQEEIYFINGAYGPEVGYAVFTFEGPGQGIVLRRDKLPMRHDWEAVTGKVLDHLYAFAAEHPELDLDLEHIAIVGASMGGYFAMRGAADPRMKACICVDSFYDLRMYAAGRMPALLFRGFVGGWIPNWLFDGLLRLLQSLSFQARWEFNHLRWVTGETSEAAIMRSIQPYTLREADGSEYLARVKCPTLVTGAAASWYYDPTTTTDKLYDSLESLRPGVDKEKWVAAEVSLGGLQAKVGAFAYSAQKTFHWLDKVWGIKRKGLP